MVRISSLKDLVHESIDELSKIVAQEETLPEAFRSYENQQKKYRLI